MARGSILTEWNDCGGPARGQFLFMARIIVADALGFFSLYGPPRRNLLRQPVPLHCERGPPVSPMSADRVAMMHAASNPQFAPAELSYPLPTPEPRWPIIRRRSTSAAAATKEKIC